MITVGIIEDDTETLEGLTEAINADPRFSVTLCASRISDAIAELSKVKTDLFLVDLDLPDGKGATLIPKLIARGAKVLVLTVLGDRSSVLTALEAGADGYLLKDTPPYQLLSSIVDTVNGQSPISPQAASFLLERFRGSKAKLPTLAHDLTERESDVLNAFSRGLSYGEAAEALSVSKGTIESHVKSIYRKLQVSSRNEAIYEGRRIGLISD